MSDADVRSYLDRAPATLAVPSAEHGGRRDRLTLLIRDWAKPLSDFQSAVANVDGKNVVILRVESGTGTRRMALALPSAGRLLRSLGRHDVSSNSADVWAFVMRAPIRGKPAAPSLARPLLCPRVLSRDDLASHADLHHRVRKRAEAVTGQAPIESLCVWLRERRDEVGGRAQRVTVVSELLGTVGGQHLRVVRVDLE